jgi:co-chaperonin GroES (HSP10)
MSFPLRLLADSIAVEPLPEGSEVQNGLILPQTTDDSRGFAKHLDCAVLMGRVVACGPGDTTYSGRCGNCGNLKTILPDRCTGLGRCRCGADDWKDTAFGVRPMNVKPGDVVLFPHRCGFDLPHEGTNYIVFHEEQFCLGVVE